MDEDPHSMWHWIIFLSIVSGAVIILSLIPSKTISYETPINGESQGKEETEIIKKEDYYSDLISEYFSDNSDLFLSIAEAESNLNPKAYNPEAHQGCYGSYSIMQVACIHYEARGIYGEDRFDVEINLQVAREVYEESGLRAWGVCHNGKVNCGF